MLSKLDKLLCYEFKFYFRIMPPLYLALLLLGLAAGFQLRLYKGGGVLMPWAAIIFICLFIAVITINLVLVIQRFRDNLLRDGGYLMFTLPVSSWALAAAKVIAAVCVLAVSALAGAAAFLALSAGSESAALPRMAEFLKEGMGRLGPAFIALECAVILTVLVQQICLIYTVMTASQVLPRFRTPAAFIAYIAAVSLAVQPVITRVIILFQAPDDSLSFLALFGLTSLGFAALFFWSAGFCLKHTLNLE
jgi:hypothetical protein